MEVVRPHDSSNCQGRLPLHLHFLQVIRRPQVCLQLVVKSPHTWIPPLYFHLLAIHPFSDIPH